MALLVPPMSCIKKRGSEATLLEKSMQLKKKKQKSCYLLELFPAIDCLSVKRDSKGLKKGILLCNAELRQSFCFVNGFTKIFVNLPEFRYYYIKTRNRQFINFSDLISRHFSHGNNIFHLNAEE
ncbi:hypothetical protein BpHYR1_025874 [Brachionus plicatilis]|uniref:Uncharacterized protein n=1 Tax=Brachionus plicatilis TaxID=10195 RepID=A0A3M7RK21_BRAPC|nr:hypothetical protein BpHYR1_025874 [Brachionus plicatilis]